MSTGSDVLVVDWKDKGAAIGRALTRAAREARAPVRIVSGGTGFRGRRSDRLFLLSLLASFVAVVVLPILVVGFYYALLASGQYATEARFSLRSGEASVLDALGGLAGGGGSQRAQDTQIIAGFVRSRAMIESLEREINLRQLFSRAEVDYFSRLEETIPIEDFVRYWRKMVDTKIDPLSGIVTLEVRAFTADDSLMLTNRILAICEKLVNDLSQRSRRDALQQAQKELGRAEAQLKGATAGMREARDSEGVLDATASAEAVNKVITTLRLELARAQQQIAGQGGSVSADAPQVRVLNSRIQTLEQQIGKYENQLADRHQGGESLADSKSHLDLKQTEISVALQRYVLASASFETARVDLETQHAYLVSFLKPMLAVKATYPKRWWSWALIAVPTLLGWVMLAAAAFLIRDHMAK
ncbi:MAG: hypothetical protein NVS2B5_11380 [Beijerinckiaceae bacterium]